MSVEIKHESTEIELEYQVSGAPAVKLGFRKTHFLPELMRVKFLDGEWVGTELRGPVAKKDGTPGASHHFNSYWPGWSAEALPDWAVPFTQWRGEWPQPIAPFSPTEAGDAD
jgi:hypothetical protein